MNAQPMSARTLADRTKAVFNRRRVGRAVTVAAVVAAITCVVGAVVAWQLLGDLRTRSAASLDLLDRTLTNVDETLAVAQDVTATVGDSLDTVRDSLATLSTGVGDGAAALESVADLTEDVPPALDRLDTTLVELRDAADVVDSALEALDELPIGPDFDADAGLAASVEGVRDDIRPIADDLAARRRSIRDLSGSSDDLVAQLSALDGDLTDLDESLDRSTELLESYRADASEAIALAEDSRDDLDRDIACPESLAVVLAGAIAVGQVAPFHIGRQLAATPDPGRDNAIRSLSPEADSWATPAAALMRCRRGPKNWRQSYDRGIGAVPDLQGRRRHVQRDLRSLVAVVAPTLWCTSAPSP